MKKSLILTGVFVLGAMFAPSEKSQSTQIGGSDVAGWFENNTKYGDELADTPISPVRLPDPIKRPPTSNS